MESAKYPPALEVKVPGQNEFSRKLSEEFSPLSGRILERVTPQSAPAKINPTKGSPWNAQWAGLDSKTRKQIEDYFNPPKK